MAKQRQVRIEQGLSPALMDEMQERTTEQLEAETKHRSIALSILGSRAAERYDAEATRTYFRRALAASRPQERPQIRRMANASLALAEHRAGDLKVAVEKLGHEAPPKRALMGLRLMGLIAPPKGAPMIRRVRGFAVIALVVILLLLIGLALVELISLPFGGGIDVAQGTLLGLLLVVVVLSCLAVFGRRRQKAAQAKAKAAKARPTAAAAAPATGRRSRGAAAKPPTPTGKSSGRSAPTEGRSRGSQPAKPAKDAPKAAGQARKPTGQTAARKPTGQTAARKTTGQTAKPGGGSKPAGQSGKPSGTTGKPSRRTRGSGPAK
ncbi:MAG TPA: hypothetical protein VIJ51_00645 [Solirubrobacteraceae bacterium]